VAVEFPACVWPNVLEEQGPSEDPSILLTGTARIGGAEARIVAIRVSSTQEWAPDFKRGVAEDSYQGNGLDEVLQMALEEFQAVASELGDLLATAASAWSSSPRVTTVFGSYRRPLDRSGSTARHTDWFDPLLASVPEPRRAAGSRGQPATGNDRRAGRIRREVRGWEQHRVGHFLRAAQQPHISRTVAG
jgi:hypothetical protein